VQCRPSLWSLLVSRSLTFGWDWLASEARYARGSFPRRAMHASYDSLCHSSAKPPPLAGLSPAHGAFQEHAAHTIEWSMMLSSNGSLGACTPKVLPHSSMPLSRRTERTLEAVSSTPWLGADAAQYHRFCPRSRPVKPPTVASQAASGTATGWLPTHAGTPGGLLPAAVPQTGLATARRDS